MNIYRVSTRTETKQWLNISGKSHDEFIDTMADSVTTLIERYIGNIVITRRFVEDVDVEKPQQTKITTTWYPIYLSPLGDNFTLYNDPNREFGASTVVSSSDYIVDDRIGEVKLVSGYFLRGRGAVRVDYWAGLSRFEIVAGANDTLKFTESGTQYTVTLSPASYNAEDLAAHIQTQMNATGTNTYAVKYDHFTQTFVFTSGSVFDLNFSETPGLARTLGFHAVDKTGLATYESDFEVNGVPDDIRLVAKMIITRWWKLSKFGEGTQEIVREIMEQSGTREYSQTPLPLGAQEILEKYKRVFL